MENAGKSHYGNETRVLGSKVESGFIDEKEYTESKPHRINKKLRKILSQPYYVECVKCGCKTRAGKNMDNGKTVCYKCFTKEGK